MPNAAAVKQELSNYIFARTPLVIINTNERERVERMIREISAETKSEIWYYTDARQIRIFGKSGSDKVSADANGDPLSFFLDKVKKSRNVTAVLGDVRRISEENLYSHQLMNLLYTARETGGTIVLVTGDSVWARIATFGMMITLDLPDTEERIAQIQKFIKDYTGRFEIGWEAGDIVRAAAVLRGFSEVQIDNILSSEIAAIKALRADRITKLGEKKQKLYGVLGSVQYIKPAEKIETAGMENLKEWLEDRKSVFFAPEELLKEYDLKAPKGILLVGVPGCGKSLTAKLVADRWGLPLFRLTTDSGNETGKRVLGEFLFWIQESDSKVFMVATANNVELLPYELYRKGRFSEVFFADLPSERERADTFRQYIKRSLHRDPEEQLIQKLVGLSKGFSYADIETAVKNVAQDLLNEISKYGTVRDPESIQEKLIECTGDIIPISTINPDMVRKIREWGMQRARKVSSAEED